MITGRSWTARTLVFVVLAAVACGEGDDGDASTEATADVETTTTSTTVGSSTSSESTSPPSVTSPVTTTDDGTAAAISLSVEVTTGGSPLRSSTVACGATAEGTGFLADPAAATAACDLLRGDLGAAQRLTYGPPADLLCIEIYGGPEVARVTGTIDGHPVDATVDRSDGCGIDDWNSLAALLGPAG